MVLLNTGYFPLMFDIPDCCTVLKQQNCLNNVVTDFLFFNSQYFYVFSLHAHSSSGKSSSVASGEPEDGGQGREDPGVFYLRIEPHSFDQSSQSSYAQKIGRFLKHYLTILYLYICHHQSICIIWHLFALAPTLCSEIFAMLLVLCFPSVTANLAQGRL